MDIKILLLGLLFINVDVFPANAGPVADAEDTVVKHESNEKYEAELLENKIDIAKAYIKSQTIKAKELMSTANVYAQVTNDRNKYAIEYNKMAEEIKEKGKKTQEDANIEAASLDNTESKRKAWEVKSREAESNGKNYQTQAQGIFADVQELTRRIDASLVAAAAADAEAAGLENIANKERNWSSDLKNKAEELFREANRNHHNKAKEAQQKANANKIKAQQQAEEAQRHFVAAKALEEQVLKAEVASLESLARYIALTIQAEEAANTCKEEQLIASMEEMLASEHHKRAQRLEGISKIIKKEIEYYAYRTKKHEGEAIMYSQSAHAVGSDFVSHSASMLKLATIKEDGEIEHDEEIFSNQKLKTMPFVAQKVIE